MIFWGIVSVLAFGCCISTALMAVVAPNAETWVQREAFSQGVRESMNLPAEDEERLARLAYEAMMSTGGLRNYEMTDVRQMMFEGAQRAEDGPILAFHEVRRALAEGSPVVCAGMWTGLSDTDEVNRALARQPDAVVLSFFRSTFQLVDAGALGGPERMTLEVALADSEALFAGAIARREPSPIDIALDAENGITPEQACAAMLELFLYIDSQPEPQRSHDARVLYLATNAE